MTGQSIVILGGGVGGLVAPMSSGASCHQSTGWSWSRKTFATRSRRRSSGSWSVIGGLIRSCVTSVPLPVEASRSWKLRSWGSM